jgi:hypothetical protein
MAALHPAHNPDPALSDCRAVEQRFSSATRTSASIPWVDDPERRPSISPWMTELYEPGQRHVMVRNPFYWKVDPEGQPAAHTSTGSSARSSPAARRS